MARIPAPPSEPELPDDIPEIEQEKGDGTPKPPLPPPIESLLFDTPLYNAIRLEHDRDEEWLEGLRFGTMQLDAHCVYCKRTSTFRTFRGGPPSEFARTKALSNLGQMSGRLQLNQLIYGPGQFAAHLACQRRGHIYSFYFLFDGYDLVKFGQTPSIEDVAGADIEKYRKILGNEFSEMKKAGGLISHGIGIGAFVYLRRIFERLVEDARATVDPKGANKEAFYKLRMAEKVDELSSALPPSVVEYKDAYGILSKGLHELSEDECKRHFPVVRAAIIAMLEERYEADAKRRAADELKKAVAAAASSVNGPKTRGGI